MMKRRNIFASVFTIGFLLMFLIQYEWVLYHKAQMLAVRFIAAPILTGLLLCFLTYWAPRFYRLVSRFESSAFMDSVLSENPSSRRALLYAALFLAIVILLTFHSIYFNGRTFLASSTCPSVMATGPYMYSAARIERPYLDTGASVWAYEPWAAKVRQEFAKGQAPLWNPNSGFGAPLLANMQSAPFSPFRLLIHLLPSQYGWDISIGLRMLIGGIFVFLYLRLFHCSFIASATAAVLFMFCGYNILHLNMGHLDVDVLAPAGVFALECIFRNPRPIRIAFGSVIVCFIILGGMPESAFCVLLLMSLYYAFRVIFFRSPDIAFYKHLAAKAWPFCISTILGLLLSGPQLFPFIEYLRNSWTTHHASTTGLASQTLIGGITAIMPRIFGVELFMNWNNLNSFHVLPYIGAVPLFLALFSVFSTKDDNNRKLIYFYSIFCFFVISKYFGFFFINWIGRLPLFNIVIFTKYMQPEFAFSIAVLAGLGIDALIQGRLASRSVFLSLFSLLGFASLYLLIKPLDLFPQLREDGIFHHVLVNTEIFLTFVLFALILTQLWRKKHSKLSLLLLAMLAIAELIYYMPRDRALRYDAGTEPPYVKFLRSDHDRHRVFGVESILYPNASSYFDIDCITNLDAMYLPGYFRFVQSFLSPDSGERFVAESMPHLDKIAPYLSLLNVKYILAEARPDKRPDLLARQALFPEKINIPADFPLVYNGEIKIFRNNNSFPRTFIVPQAICADNEEAALDLLRKEKSNLRNIVVLEDAAAHHCSDTASNQQGFQSGTQIERYSSREIVVRTQSSRDSFLVLTDSYYPGWKAFIDGQEQTILRADRLFRALPLKTGSHTVRFMYNPASYSLGLISLIVSFIALGVWVVLKRQ
jgi:hypothetical protein